jgi:hypothetical protein
MPEGLRALAFVVAIFESLTWMDESMVFLGLPGCVGQRN